MDIRNIQRTGNMHYVYLPTSWCKKHKIGSDSKVSLKFKSDGALSLIPEIKETAKKEIKLNINEENQEIIAKLIIACYVNPAQSFIIQFESDIDTAALLDQKKSISALEFVEFEENQITHESSITVNEPDRLLKTMIKKIKNMLNMMVNNYNKEIINKYEEEIDRSNLMIYKSVIGALTMTSPSKLRPIDLHYISLISQDLERMVDFLIKLDNSENEYLTQVLKIIDMLKDIIEDPDYKNIMDLTKEVLAIKQLTTDTLKNHNKMQVRTYLNNICDVLFDWSISNQIID